MTVITVCGPMFSGKSSYLLEYEKKCIISKRKYILVNHSSDTRYSSNNISTHNGKSGVGISYSVSILSDLEYTIVNETQVIIIDECQFFNDVSIFLDKWGNDKTIICGGLNSTFKLEPFPNMSEVISRSDKIIHLTSICQLCGDDAPFTKRISNEVEVNIVGGIDKYVPRCRKCFNSLEHTNLL
jgi:thymidine kinase